MSLTPLTDDQALDAQVASGELLVAYCSTPTCGVCKVLRPKVDALLERRSIPGVYLDTTQHTETAGQRLVFTVPTVLIFADGREIQRYGRHFSLSELDAFLARVQDAMAG